MSCGDCVKMCEDFALNFGDKRLGCCIMTPHCLTLPFSPGSFWPKDNCRLPPTLLFSASTIEDKTDRLPFWHNWNYRSRIADGAEHPHRTQLPRSNLKSGRSAWNSAYTRKVTTLSIMMVSSLKVRFWPNGSTSPRNYGWHFVRCCFDHVYTQSKCTF
jgi:hypothetical protein